MYNANLVLPFCFEKEDLQRGFTKRELIECLDGLVELASEENKVKAVLVNEKFISDFTDMKRKRVLYFLHLYGIMVAFIRI